ncbi:MAG: hypothetical protein ACK4YQ_14575 [Phenylobacterium sp.]|uniref:hypothetical protein n=1 Tax=Phenylobacterium sp. TaxID=1871053 RepID=UPI00391D23D0
MPTITRRRAIGALLAGAGLAPLAACKLPSADPQAEAAAKSAYAHFWRGEDEALQAMLVPQLRNPQTMAALEGLRTLTPVGPPTAATLVEWRSFFGEGGRQITLSHRYDYADASVTATTVLVPGEAKDEWLIQTFNLNFSAPPSAAPAPARPGGRQV